ncbi:DUF4179 domain-containing protein [Paenibacillus sp. YN15]|uniref:DUF4179 domain-containing protein n=1 Tax=Paenibacillus sp. YN15 TaxID=1742774 RepID=UPI000DCD61DF|nr:DUF4179 domain-containing protein [Paenibacillus sp. YN15]RAU92377.1 hypothetical protein DQG13_27765 [Paenibacillus sp. YN15]
MNEASHAYEQELKQQFQETQLPRIQLQVRVLEAHDERTTQKINKPVFGRRLLAASCSIIAVILLFGALSSFPASAEKLRRIPIMGRIFKGDIFSFAGDSGIVSSKSGGLSSPYNKMVSDNGVAITLQDVIYDGARLSIGYEIHSEQTENIIFLGKVSIKINGVSKPGAAFSTKPHRLNANQAVGIMTLDIDEPGAEDSFELELNIGEVTGPKDENGNSAKQNRVAGDWSFKLSVANKTLKDSQHRALADGYGAESRDGRFQLTGYLLTPVTTKLEFEFAGDTDWLLFQLKDERGMIINYLDSQWTIGKDGVSRGTVRFAPLASGAKEVYVTPYRLLAHKQESQKVTSPLTKNFPIVLSQGEVGEVIVNNVVFKNDQTLIYYEVKGKAPHTQSASLWLETADGQMIITDSGERTRISDTSYAYILEYPPLDPSQSYVLGTMTQTDIKLLDELTIKLELEP